MTHTKPADRILFYAFLGFLVWLPLPRASVPTWALGLMVLGACSIQARWLYLYIRGQVRTTRVFRKAIPAICLLTFTQLWVFISLNANILGLGDYVDTLDHGSTHYQLLHGLALLSIFACTLLLLRSRRRIKITLFALIISGVAQATYGSLMTLSGAEYNLFFPKEHYLGVATGTFVNRNHLAGYLELILSIGIGYMIATLKDDATNWRDLGRRFLEALLGSKARVRISLVIMVAALVMTHSRMGNTAFFASMSIAGAIALLLGKRASKSTTVLLASLLVIDLIVVGTFFGVEKVVDRLENTSMETIKRDNVNEYALPLLEEHLYTGAGAGSFYSIFPEYREADLGKKPFLYAHNDYLQFTIEFGLIGFVPLLIFVVLTFVTALRAQWIRKDPLMRGISFASLMGIIAFGIHSAVDFNLQIPANTATFMVILALGWISLHHKEAKSSQTSSSHT